MFVRGKFVCFYPTFIIQQLTTCSPFLIFLFCYTKSIIIHICTHATSTMHHIDNMYTCMRQPHVHAKSLYTNVHRRTPMYNTSTYTAPEHQLCQVQKRMQNKIKEEKKKKSQHFFSLFYDKKPKKYQSNCVRTRPQRTQQYSNGLLFTVATTCNATTATISNTLFFIFASKKFLQRIFHHFVNASQQNVVRGVEIAGA